VKHDWISDLLMIVFALIALMAVHRGTGLASMKRRSLVKTIVAALVGVWTLSPARRRRPSSSRSR
jgi:hypothetical protein